MGDTTYQEFQSELKFNLKQRADLESHTVLGNMLGRWTNKAYMNLVAKNRFWDKKLDYVFPGLNVTDTTKTTAAGRAYITEPSDCLVINHIWDRTNDVKLENITMKEYVGYTGRSTTTSRGKSDEWVRQDVVYLHPTPDDTYNLTIYYRKKPAKLSSDSDVTAIGNEWDDVIVALATYQSFMRLNDMEKSLLWRAEYTSLISELIGVYNSERRDVGGGMYPDFAYLGKFKS